MANNFDTKLRKARNNWIKDYQHSISFILRNSLIIENLRRTVRPLKHYYKFLETIDISSRTASRFRMIGEREMNSNIISKNESKLPASYGTLEIILKLTDEEIRSHIKSNKIKASSSRKDIHLLISGNKDFRDTTLKDNLRHTSPFADIRIEKGFDDEGKLMRLLKDLHNLRAKYPFVHTDDKGYVDRTKRNNKLLAEKKAEQKKMNKPVSAKQQKLEDELMAISGMNSTARRAKFANLEEVLKKKKK